MTKSKKHVLHNANIKHSKLPQTKKQKAPNLFTHPKSDPQTGDGHKTFYFNLSSTERHTHINKDGKHRDQT